MKWLMRVAAVVALIWAAYWLASTTTRYGIDRTVTVLAPVSEKSKPEIYRFGYMPELEYTEIREQCAERNVLKNAYFGDLHIHTMLSSDAYADGTRVFPPDAYAFAKGGSVGLPRGFNKPIESYAQLERPLDFAAVTDHSEALGEGYICRTEGAFPGYAAKACKIYREGNDPGVRVFSVPRAGTRPRRLASVCGEDSADCEAAARIVWQSIIDAAEAAYDKSADCAFTSFVGYEYTRSPNGMHMHRNTIFRNASVPDYPANYTDYLTLPALLGKLETECRDGIAACDVISIPHNSNISSGNAFNPRALEGYSDEARQAHRFQRQAFDRLMEITQHKGASECVNGVSDILSDTDEYCGVEAIREPGNRERSFDITGWLPRVFNRNLRECSEADWDPKDNLYKGPCIASHDFARGAWLSGLQEDAAQGVNPFEMGVIGSTDTHLGLAGNTSEHDYPGHIAHEVTLEGRLGEAGLGRHNRLEGNPGGLAGVWAVENSRDALFQSMKRREAFATSGTRIAPRFFAGRYEADICAQDNWLEIAYAQGVPMGARLPAGVNGLSFIAQATRDPSGKASNLKALQVIKGWIDDEGRKRALVTPVAVSGDETGETEMCARYVDPDYDPLQQAYYYMRVVEQPTLRWSAAQCSALNAEDKPAACEGIEDKQITEFAWTSPIWVTPADAAPLPVTP